MLSNTELKPPRHLRRADRELWCAVVEEYRINDGAGLTSLATAAQALDRMQEARDAIKRQGPVIEDRYGQPKAHPALKIEVDARDAPPPR